MAESQPILRESRRCASAVTWTRLRADLADPHRKGGDHGEDFLLGQRGALVTREGQDLIADLRSFT